MTKCLNSAGVVDIPAISSEMIETGSVYIEVYPMLHDDEGACLTTKAGEQPDFYDVHLRADDLAINGNDTYAEWEDLSLEDATAKIAELENLYPGIAVNWVNS